MIEINIKAESLLKIGLSESIKKNYDVAIKSIEEAQKLFLETKDIHQIAICLTELALIHYKNNKDRLIRSLTLLNDAKALVQSNTKNEDIEAKILHYYGIIYYSEKRFSEALKYFKNAKELANPDNIEYARILDSLSVFYLRMNNYQVASKYISEALKSKEKLNNDYETAITEMLFGRYLSNIESYDEAINYLSKALKILEKEGDQSSIARLQEELAKTYLAKNNIKMAEILCSKSIELAKSSNNALSCAFSCCTMAGIKIELGKAQEALDIIENEVEPVFKNFITVRGFAIAKRLKGIVYHKCGQKQLAITNIQEAADLFKEAELQTEVAKSYYELSRIYKDNYEADPALETAIEAINIAKLNNAFVLVKKLEDLIFEIDKYKWSNIINDTSHKEIEFTEIKQADAEVLSLVGDIVKTPEKSTDPLLSLLRIGRSIAAETDIDKLLEIITEETKIALKSDRCTVFLVDKSTNELWSKVALGMGEKELRFPINLGLAGHVATTGETINIKDAYGDKRFNKEIDKKTGYITKTILCMPMRNFNHEIIGVFQVLNKAGENSFFTAEDEDLLVAIASSAGIALENASLFKKQQIMLEEQTRSFNSFVKTLAASIDARDKITSGHSTRVTGYAVTIAKQMELGSDEIDVLEYAAMLHDFGKIGIRDSVLCKEGKLTDEEYKHIQEHAYLTNEILKNMYFADKFKDVAEIASSHHEKFNGMGYFRGVKGEDIPLGGRILAVADVFDAITSKRHYRDRMAMLQVLNILRKDSGSHFDGSIVDYFFRISIDKIFNVMLMGNETLPGFDTSLTNEEIKIFSEYTMDDLHQMFLKPEEERSDDEKHLIQTFENRYNPKDAC